MIFDGMIFPASRWWALLDTILEWLAALVVAQASCLRFSGLLRPTELTGKMPVPLRCCAVLDVRL